MTVPMPIITTSNVVRIACTASKAGIPVMIMRSPTRRPIMPSAETASLRVMCGSPFLIRAMCPELRACGLAGQHAGGHRDPGRAESGVALAGRSRIGVLDRASPTRATRASTSASEHGGTFAIVRATARA